MKRIPALAAAVLAAAGAAAPASAQWSAGATIGWGGARYETYAPYRYGWVWYGSGGPWGLCSAGACVDNPYVRRMIQRELTQFEHLRDLDEQARSGLPSDGALPYGARRAWPPPPPTPDAQVQPAYRGSGEIRPEFISSGQPRQDVVRPQR